MSKLTKELITIDAFGPQNTLLGIIGFEIASTSVGSVNTSYPGIPACKLILFPNPISLLSIVIIKVCDPPVLKDLTLFSIILINVKDGIYINSVPKPHCPMSLVPQAYKLCPTCIKLCVSPHWMSSKYE